MDSIATDTSATNSSHLPAPILTLPNVLVRPYHPQDAASIATSANNPLVARYMTNAFPSPYTLSSAARWITIALTPPISHFALTLPTSPTTVIGGIGLKPGFDVHAHSAELGYWLAEPYWNRGIISAAVEAFVAWTMLERLDVRRVWAGVCGGNEASERVLGKCGFRREGVMREHVVKGGEVMDLSIWGLTRGDWEEREWERRKMEPESLSGEVNIT